MKKRLFLFTTLIIFAGLLCFFATSVYITYNNNLNIAKGTVMETARICAGLYNDDTDVSTFVKVGGDTRITVISSDGKVLADSRPLDIGTVQNHLNRPEIQAAASGTPSAYVRYSDTLGVDFIYYALKVASGGGYLFIRAAVPVAKIDAYLFQSLPLLALLFSVIALLCFILSRSMINRITRPFALVEKKLRLLSNGEYTSEPFAQSYEEIDAITKEIDEFAQVLQSSFISLQDEKNKVEYILNNIGDGVFAVDENKNIAMINSAVLSIFDAKPDIADKNVSFLLYDKPLMAAVDDCVTHEKSSLFEFNFNGKIYLTTVKRLPETQLTMTLQQYKRQGFRCD